MPNVRAALNRGEDYHQLRRIIAEANGGIFRGKSDLEIENGINAVDYLQMQSYFIMLHCYRL
jgi:hypothetical protein